MTDISLHKTTVLVTGAARGLGRAMTLALLRAGANVAALDLDRNDPEFSSLSAEAEGKSASGHLLILGGDIRDASGCEGMVNAAVERFGALHGLVNNAGIGMQGFGAVLVGDKPRAGYWAFSQSKPF